jgi:uncharacterized protein (TIGR02466 family)
MSVRKLFPTLLYDADIDAKLLPELAHSIRTLACDDKAGRKWSREHNYPGYTSYASLDDLRRRDPALHHLGKILTRHARAFARELGWEARPRLDSLWANLLKPGGHHSGHIHPHSILSGALYVEAPAGAGAIRFEDPRLGLMMAAPMRRPDAAPELQPFLALQPRPGLLLMWESWLRHEVLPGTGRGDRLSLSFNFA